MNLLEPILASLGFLVIILMSVAGTIMAGMSLIALYYSIKILSAYIKLNNRRNS